MATFQADAALAGAPVKSPGQGSQEVVTIGTYEITAALALNDVIEMVKVPENATVTRVILGTDDLDTGGSPAIVLDVGDDGDTDRFVDGATVGQAGGITDYSNMAMTGFGYTYTADNTIDVLVQVAPATGATTGTVTLVVGYTMP